MKYSRPLNIAIFSSLLIVAIFNVIYIGISYFTNHLIHIDIIAIVSILLLVISFLIFKITIEKFLYDKIKLIYKTIHSHKAPTGSKFGKIDLSKNVLSDVNHDVVSWMQDRNIEIEQLKKLEEFRRSFIGNVSHELKTPVFNIQGYISTLMDGAHNDPAVCTDYLSKADKNIDRMIAILEDLDTISRLESGILKPDFAAFDIVSVTKDIIELLEEKAKQKNMRLYQGANSESPQMVYADQENIRQVIVNLVDNAIKYGKDNGRVKISYYDMDENILVEVSDDGIGIAPEYLPRIFERFFRVDKSRSRELGGSGLGLAIVKHIIEAHQQTVHARSTQGVGSTFSFTLKKAKKNIIL